ncbi:conserved hypthetical protein [Thermoplasma acidophilum]|uniref:Conserved hypthetical protein n=1 Tax=Thermoplasma acidophilum (strain ATCC 25905 / DSM 1728 / JCM 9062 / NBRC 15155 / AMRC-C165) TaxID=273075 RepID=Q9HIZ0_THEAC|nr:metalloregulator ArsR/SmtB family transcription factor [Thermoplasma acidophilum]MCY0852143.1 transcriptional regulator [Thermoplasma acidophilum]CAC12311.1 conserved hypthetical protein [Thermoplasma acidophilum]
MDQERIQDSYPTESRILMALKKSDGMTLQEIAQQMGLSKMAILKHMQVLENRHLVERRIAKGDMGRPFYRFYLLRDSSEAFGSSGDKVLTDLIDFLDSTGNRDLVVKFLEKRYKDVAESYRLIIGGVRDDERVEKLTQLRYEENYVPELKKVGNGKYELLEYNCPIFTVSRKFGEACALECHLFESVLGMKVVSSHTQVNGHGTCKFIIEREKKEP